MLELMVLVMKLPVYRKQNKMKEYGIWIVLGLLALVIIIPIIGIIILIARLTLILAIIGVIIYIFQQYISPFFQKDKNT